MKKTENLKSVILLLIATGIAIGLLSSTAVKLASATTLLKQTNSLSSVKLADEEETSEETTEETTEEATDAPTDKPNTDDTTSPSGGSNNSGNGGSNNSGNGGSNNSGNGGSNNSGNGGSNDSGSGDSGGGILDTITGLLGGLGGIELPDLGGILGGGDEPEETPDEPEVNTAEFKSIMTSYKAVVDMAKLTSTEYTKTTERTIEWNVINNLFIGNAGNITVDDVKYFNNTIVTTGITNKDPSFVINNKFACTLNTLDEGAVDEAVKSAQKTTLDDGNTKIVIELNDSTPDGFVNTLLPVVTADQVKALFNSGISAGLTDVTVTYTGCSIELVYNAYTGEIISLTQYIRYDVDATGTKSFSTTITETNVYEF